MVHRARMVGGIRGIECPYHCCRYTRDVKKYVRGLKKRDRQAAKKQLSLYR